MYTECHPNQSLLALPLLPGGKHMKKIIFIHIFIHMLCYTRQSLRNPVLENLIFKETKC